jgi:hypothetical protein
MILIVPYLKIFSMKKLDSPQLVLKVLATHTENHFPARRKVDIKDGKILIQRDLTEVGIANDLVELGLQKTNLVLSYISFSSLMKYTPIYSLLRVPC